MAEKQGDTKSKLVPLKLRFNSPEDFLQTYVKDPSLKGITVPAQVPVQVGTLMDLVIEFGGGKGIRTAGEVMWNQPAAPGETGSVGISFRNMPAAYQTWLDKAASELLPKQQQTKTGDAHLLRKATSALELDGASDMLVSVSKQSGDPVVGIDLGTSNSCVCAFVDGKPHVLDLSESELETQRTNYLPSIVAYDENGAVTLGKKALDGLQKNPKHTIWGAKRFIGLCYDSPAVSKMLGHFPYRIVPGPGGRVGVEINGKAVNVTSVSGKLLREMKERASRALGAPVRRAIITVPAYYNENQRDAVVNAGRLAGLTVERIINEPTAAAIAYGLTQAKPRRLLVYDLGGGTFDVSVMSVHQGTLQVLATAGDTFLGGEDFDNVITDYVYKAHEKKQGKKGRLSINHTVRALIKTAAEEAKKRLSTRDSTMIVVREAPLLQGGTTRLEVELTREMLERLVAPLIERTLKICDMAIRAARLAPDALNDVLLVGGQTRMPIVRNRVRDYFKISPRADLNPDEVVAMGAGMLANLSPEDQGKFRDVLSMSIGIAVGSQFKPLVPRNTTLPYGKSFRLNVPKAKFADYTLDMWQGDHKELRNNEFLGTLTVNAISPGEFDPVPIRVDLGLTADCLLKLRVTHEKTEESQQVLLNTRDA